MIFEILCPATKFVTIHQDLIKDPKVFEPRNKKPVCKTLGTMVSPPCLIACMNNINNNTTIIAYDDYLTAIYEDLL